MTSRQSKEGGASGPLHPRRSHGPRRIGWVAVLALLPLVLGLANASGSTLSVSTVTVEVIGQGRVASAPAGLDCGNGATTCDIAFSGSGVVTLTPAAATDWSFDGWAACPSVTPANTCEVPIDGSASTVTANFAGPPVTTSTLSATFTGSGNVSGGNIDCGSSPAGATCAWTVLTGSTLTIRQAPAPDNVFTGWGGACGGTSVACTVELTGDRSVSAAWASSTGVLLTVSVSGGGTVTGAGITCPSTCAATQAVNASVVLTAEAADGSTFAGWDGACSGTAATCIVLMSDTKSVTATFSPVVELQVAVSGSGNVSGGGGAINCGSNGDTCSARVAVGTTVSLAATPATGAGFSGWSGACGGANPSCTIVMNAAKSVTATFKSNNVPLTVRVTGPGRVSGGGIDCGSGGTTCSANQSLDADVTLTATPASGGTFTGWTGACTGTTSTCSVSMTSAKSVGATFSGGPPATVSLTVSVTGRGRVTGGSISCGNGTTTCTLNASLNASVTLTATPATGATFAGWSGACSGTLATCTVTMNTAKSVGASFSDGNTGTLTLTIAVTGPGTVSSSAGKCSSRTKKTCAQHFAAGSSVVVTATPFAGARFNGWGGDCSGAKTTCTVVLTRAKTLAAGFFKPLLPPKARVLTSVRPPQVELAGGRFRVSLRFRTTRPGTAQVRGMLAGRTVATLARRVGAGPVVIGFTVAKRGVYTFEIRLGGETLRWRTCVGACTA